MRCLLKHLKFEIRILLGLVSEENYRNMSHLKLYLLVNGEIVTNLCWAEAVNVLLMSHFQIFREILKDAEIVFEQIFWSQFYEEEKIKMSKHFCDNKEHDAIGQKFNNVNEIVTNFVVKR